MIKSIASTTWPLHRNTVDTLVAVRLAPKKHWTALYHVVLLLGSLSAGFAQGAEEFLDCTVPRPDQRLSQCSVVRFASEFPNCLSSKDISAHTCIVMDTSLDICANQTPLPITVFFDRNDKTLDCQDGIIDHGWGRNNPTGSTATSASKRMPAVRFMDDRSLSNITVQNCTIRGTNHIGIEATRFFGGELGGDGLLDETEALPVGHSKLTFKDLTIEDIVTGIYLGTFSKDVDIDRVRIDNASRIAIYSEAGTHRLRIRHSTITNTNTREALALDSTYDSEVSNTTFINNREGAINLYQNCGELKGIVCPVIRPTPPDNNLITNNTFVNNGVSGIHIASRQGRNHSLGWCASLAGLPGKFKDTAQDNIISNNTLGCLEGTALIVNDGPNVIRDNHIVAREHCVPFEISTGGLGPSESAVLDGLNFTGNTVDSIRPPRLRNLGDNIKLTD